MRGIRARLGRLERAAPASRGRCPHCPPAGLIALVEVDQTGNLLSGQYPPRCARCGPHDGGIRFIEVVVPMSAEELLKPSEAP